VCDNAAPFRLAHQNDGSKDNMISLDGRTAAITGAGGELGRAYATAMARAGAALALCDINLEAAQATADAVARAGGKAIAVQADVTQAADFERLFDRAEAELGPLDILLNIAGIFPRSFVAEMDEAEWDRVIAINLKSVFLGTRAALRRMLPRGRGNIVSTASGTGMRGQPRSSHYAASKAGIIAFTRAVSLELKGTGVRINCFGPGATDTPLWRIGKSREDIERLLAAGNVFQPDEFSSVVLFLASDESAPLSGEFIARDPYR
jgi:NAD(P)-dependent dehydrogenase (short-subunit alcohol dehydrogenase family)